MNYGLGGYGGAVETCYSDGFSTRCAVQPAMMGGPMMGPMVTTPFWTTTFVGGWWYWVISAIIIIIIIAVVLAVTLGKSNSSSSSSSDSVVPAFSNSVLVCNNLDTGLSLNPVETMVGTTTGIQIHLSSAPSILRSRYNWDGQSIFNSSGYLSRADDGHLYLNATKEVARLVRLVPTRGGYMMIDQSGRYLVATNYTGMVTTSQYQVKTVGIGTTSPLTFVVVSS